MDDALGEWGLWDDGLSPLQWQERYIRFKDIEFPLAPQQFWPRLRRDLLECGETYLACR